jgi:hypothetical protein
MEYAKGSASGRYKAWQSERTTYLEEAFRSALLTIPSVVPDQQDIMQRSGSTKVILAKPFQSLGARGVNNLASKLLLTLFPPTSPFLKYVVSAHVQEEAQQTGTELGAITSALAKREARIQSEVDLRNVRPKGFQIIRHLLISGNCAVYVEPESGDLQVYGLNTFVVRRDGRGSLIEMIVCEILDRHTIEDEDVLAAINSIEYVETESPAHPEKVVALYTSIKRDGKNFKVCQEVGGVEIENTEQTYTEETLPWLCLRYIEIDGEDYGRGFVEEYRGDLTSLEQLSRDILFASANAAKIVWGIDPTSPLKPKKFMETVNGGAVLARKDDVQAIQLQKTGDMQVAAATRNDLVAALSADFMLNSSFQRQAERVTAEEIRKMAEELEDTLGGVFSMLSQSLQLPLARLYEASLIKRGELKKLPKDSVRIGVVTGLAAIGRGQDLMRLREALALTGETAVYMPELPSYLKASELISQIFTGAGIATEGLIKDSKQVEEEQMQAQRAQSQQIVGSELAKGAGQAVGSVGGQMAPEQLAGALQNIPQAQSQ